MFGKPLARTLDEKAVKSMIWNDLFGLAWLLDPSLNGYENCIP
jgi:hypothetical protein